MFNSLIFPFLLTFIMMIGFIGLSTAYAPRFKWKRWIAFIASLLLAIIAFVPSCSLTMKFVDHFRYGEFHHDSFEDVNDWRVERYLPDEAVNITLIKDGGKFHAKFFIDKERLDQWVNKFHAENTDYSQMGNYEEFDPEFIKADFKSRFDSIQWSAPSDIIRYGEIRKGNGGGFKLYYSQSEGMAYTAANYW